jgi:hypothetical protein
MPAQWPVFINRISSKLSSMNSSSIDEFAVFVANEYFNSVSTSQTMYGNTHQPGEKQILENGFKQAFKKIYEEEEIEFDSKSTNPAFADLTENPTAPDITYDALCEVEKWADQNKEQLEKFIFYPFFSSTCPIEDPNNLPEDLSFDNVTEITDPFAEKPPRSVIPTMTEDERVLNVALRVIYQNDKTINFRKWVDRLDTGYNSAFGAKVKKKVQQLLNQSIENTTINQYIFQEEHLDKVDNIPEWLTPINYICKFVYIREVDAIGNIPPIIFNAGENERILRKEKDFYDVEKTKWHQRLSEWSDSQLEIIPQNQEGGDGYDVMATTIIDYWKSTATQPFKPSPPISPCTSVSPSGGTYVPISYGDRDKLANDLRKAWNTGKRFRETSMTPVASSDVASAIAVACSNHLLKVKFLYLGGFIVPSGPPVPMSGISPTTF